MIILSTMIDSHSRRHYYSMTTYKINDIVLTQSCKVPAMDPVHVKLIKKVVVHKKKGNNFDWPEYIGWHAELTKKKEVKILRKRWNIPYSFPDNIETFIYEEEIIKKL